MSAAQRRFYDEIARDLIEHMKHIPDAENIIRGYFQDRMKQDVKAEQQAYESLFGAQYKQQQAQNSFYNTFFRSAGADQKAYGGSRAYGKSHKTRSFADMFEEAYRQATGEEYPKAEKKKASDPATRRKEIENELDIIRGRVPTPKGYKVNPANAKSLMKELKELEGK